MTVQDCTPWRIGQHIDHHRRRRDGRISGVWVLGNMAEPVRIQQIGAAMHVDGGNPASEDRGRDNGPL